MGGICIKKQPKESKPKQQYLAEQFYVETKLDDVPTWAELEWHNLLRKNELSMDQDNIKRKTNDGRIRILKIRTNSDGEKLGEKITDDELKGKE